MMHLLKIEWLKLKKYRTFYILFGLFVAVFLSTNLLMNTGPFSVNISKEMKVSVFNDDYSFAFVWDNLGYYFGWALIFICVFVIVNICNEIQYKTNRQHIIDGYSRLDFLHGKVILILAINVALTLFILLVGLIFGYTNGGGNPFHHAAKILHVFVLGLNYLSFSALMALLIKRSGLTIMLLFAFVFAEGIIVALFGFKFKTAVAAFLPLESSDALFPTPFNQLAKQVSDQLPQNSAPTLVLMSCVFIGIYYFIARRKMQTADI